MPYTGEMVKNQAAIMDALKKINSSLLDADAVFSEIEMAAPLTCKDRWTSDNIDLDEFDWAGIKFKPLNNKPVAAVKTDQQTEPGSPDFCRSVEALISNGFLWEADQEDYSMSQELLTSLGLLPDTGKNSDTNELLQIFNSLPANEIDIFSADDSIFETFTKINNFEINVPIKICSENDDWVIKANLPDIVFTPSETDDIPEQLSFKSVLALLPERINIRQLRPSFIDGQFRLEIPKREDLTSSKIK